MAEEEPDAVEEDEEPEKEENDDSELEKEVEQAEDQDDSEEEEEENADFFGESLFDQDFNGNIEDEKRRTKEAKRQ